MPKKQPSSGRSRLLEKRNVTLGPSTLNNNNDSVDLHVLRERPDRQMSDNEEMPDAPETNSSSSIDQAPDHGSSNVMREKKSSDLSVAGDEVLLTEAGDNVQKAATSRFSPEKADIAFTAGNLRKRRLSSSPEKFNTGHFEPLSIHASSHASTTSPRKRQRIRSNMQTTYAAKETTHISSVSQNATSTEEANSANDEPMLAMNSGSIIPGVGRMSIQYILNDRVPMSTPGGRKFNILNAFLRRSDLLKHLVSCLSIPSLISLYSISKAFHYLFNRNQTTFILASMRTWAPGSDYIYPWRCYKALCIKDPHRRLKNNPAKFNWLVKERHYDLRDVPGLRWLQMVVWREGICRDMLIQLAVKGLLCPPGTLDAIKRTWFLLDLPLNHQRVGVIDSKTYFTNETVERMMHFLLKVDMSFTCPNPPQFPANHPNQRRYPNRLAGALVSGVSLRKLLLAEPSFTPLWRVLRGWTWDPQMPRVAMTRLDILRLWVRHSYTPPLGTPDFILKESILAVPWWEVGNAGLERVGVAWNDLGNPQKTLVDPSIVGGDTTMSLHRRDQLIKRHELLYPHRRRIIVTTEKPREKLLGPDELCLRANVRRGMMLHTKWIEMMLYGFCDDLGVNIPLRTEEEWSDMVKTAPLPGKKEGN